MRRALAAVREAVPAVPAAVKVASDKLLGVG